MEIKFFVRTTGERQLDESFNQIDYELLIDDKHDPVASFISQLVYINDYNAVLLEDDVILCKNFKERIENVINQNPTDIINFFTNPLIYFTTQYSLDFCYNQCTFYPQGISEKIAVEMIDLLDSNLIKFKEGYDSLESRALKRLQIPHLKYRPSLVQHNDKKSLITKSSPDRITPYFIDYFDELNIEYNSKDALLKRSKLFHLRNNHLNIDILNKKSS